MLVGMYNAVEANIVILSAHCVFAKGKEIVKLSMIVEYSFYYNIKEYNYSVTHSKLNIKYGDTQNYGTQFTLTLKSYSS